MFSDSKFIIICGYYGVGKTNFSLNLALQLREKNKKVTLVDLDLVNPYFRISEYTVLLEKKGIKTIIPDFANSNLDLSLLPSNLCLAFLADEGYTILDVGGDDRGAMVLGGIRDRILQQDSYQMFYLINQYRPYVSSVANATQLFREIESVSGLQITGIINNSHLQEETTKENILDSISYAQRVAALCEVPLIATTIPEKIRADFDIETDTIYPVQSYVRLPW